MKKFIIYNRKSTDETDKQELSLDSQSRENRALADRLGLQIHKELFEAKSARKKGRPVFSQMIEELKEGKADGVVAWKLDRLTRNLFDTATIAELGQEGIDFKFCSGSFDNSPSGLANLAVQGAFAKLYVDQLAEDTRRGLNEKFLRGELPGWAPTGYINRDKEVYLDPDVAPFVKRAFELYAYSDMSLLNLAKQLASEGFRGRKGGIINKGTIEKIFDNPFYYGFVRYRGELRQGVHTALIDKDLWDKVQEKLHQKANPRPFKYNYVFRGLMICGQCGRNITAEQHKGFTYYRCTKSGGPGSCNQSYIREEELDQQISEGVKLIAIDDEILHYIKDALKTSHSQEIELRDNSLAQLNRQLGQIQNRLDSLLDAMIDGTISKETYTEKARLYNVQKQEISEQIKKHKVANENWFDAAEKFLELAHQSYNLYKVANLAQKRQLVSAISSNSSIYNKKVLFNLKEPFKILAKGTSLSKKSNWLPDRDSNPD